MTSRTAIGLVAAGLLVITSGCTRDLDPLNLAPFSSDPAIFIDSFGEGVSFLAFAGSKTDAVQFDATERFRGTASLRVTVPVADDPSGGFAGGAFTSNVVRDLTSYNALTFWAKASTAATLNTAGLGNDNSGTSKFIAEASALPLSTSWTKYVLPIPLATKLDREAGLFFFAEGAEQSVSYNIWFDEMQFENLGTLTSPRPSITTQTVNGEVGSTLTVQGAQVTFDVGGSDQTMVAAPGYFTFTSSDPSVATANEDGAILFVGAGSATITASLGGTPADGTVTVNVAAPPSVAAPTPEVPSEDVVSLFSGAYTDATVDTWSAVWDNADVSDAQIAGDDVKKYDNLVLAGIEFTSQPVDASEMTDLHLDLWTQDASSFSLKLVDFGANGVFGGGDDSEHDIVLNEGSSPALTTGSWNSLDIPLSAFAGLQSRGNLAQIVITSASPTIYLDNFFFFKKARQEPDVGAPTPTRPSSAVISLFSDRYDDVPVSTWSAEWDNADVADVAIAGNNAKLYTGLVFAGIEFKAPTVDATAMTHLHMDIWTPDSTDPPADFRIKLVDVGANGDFGGGDDVEHEIALTSTTNPALGTGTWVGLDVPLADFAGLVTRGHLAQMIITGGLSTVYVDNVYFYGPTPESPPQPAPTPTLAAANVISLFSNPYDDVNIDTWSAGWDDADLEDLQIGGNDTKKYTNFAFAGIEFTSQPIDATGMTHFHIDIWTPDPTAAPASFNVKIVDFGANGTFQGGDDTEHEITLNASSTPPLTSGEWLSYDIPFTEFTGLTTRGHLAQIVLVSGPNTVFIDNVYLHN